MQPSTHKRQLPTAAYHGSMTIKYTGIDLVGATLAAYSKHRHLELCEVSVCEDHTKCCINNWDRLLDTIYGNDKIPLSMSGKSFLA